MDLVGDPVSHHGVKTGVAQDDFLHATRSRVAVPVHFRVLHQASVKLGDPGEELFGQYFTGDFGSAKRTNDGGEVAVKALPTLFDLSEGKRLVATHREQQVGEAVHETIDYRMRRHMLGVLRRGAEEVLGKGFLVGFRIHRFVQRFSERK